MLELKLVVGPFQCNCRVLACPRTGEAVIVDPGDEAAHILESLRAARIPGSDNSGGKPIQVKYLLHTHAHLDHVGATRGVHEGLPSRPRIALHRADEEIYRNLKLQGRMFGLEYDDPLPVEHYLEHEEELRFGDLRFSVIHTPGHSPGSVSFRLHEDSRAGIAETVFSGDTLFQGSVGRTDLWGADQGEMFRMIRTRLLTLDDDTKVCPGHGPDSRIGIEKRENPFLI